MRVIQLAKSLPPEEQKFICTELSKHASVLKKPKEIRLRRTANGDYFNPEGLPNDDPVFKILEDIEAERHQTPGPPPPELD